MWKIKTVFELTRLGQSENDIIVSTFSDDRNRLAETTAYYIPFLEIRNESRTLLSRNVYCNPSSTARPQMICIIFPRV